LVLFLGGFDRDVADRAASYQLGDGHVPLEERRGDRKDVGVVVETVPGIVDREQRSRIDVQRQQVANRIAVLGAIEAVYGGPAGVRVGSGSVVELRFKPVG